MSTKPRLTTTTYGVLGLLAVRPHSTYELAKGMDRSIGRIWPRAQSKLFEEPKKLVAHGYAEARDETRPGGIVSGASDLETVRVRVQAASWIDADTLRVFVDGVEAGSIALDDTTADPLEPTVRFDDDVDIGDMSDVMWAVATRVRAEKDIILIPGCKGAILDPTSDPETFTVTKMGIDATRPVGQDFAERLVISEEQRARVRGILEAAGVKI